MRKIGLTLLTAFAGGAMAIGTYKVFEKDPAEGMTFEDRQKVYFASNKSNTANMVSSAGDVDFVPAAAAVTPAVVYIRTTYATQQGRSGGRDPLEEMFGDMFGQRMQPQQRQPQRASGSGVIISTDGYIVTNNHVVANASKVEVTTNDHRTLQAKVIGTDPNTDLALIKVTATNLPIVKLGNSDDVKVGEWVLAVGNPFNLNSTVTAGIVSAKGRNIGIIGSEQEEEQQNPFGRSRYQQQQQEPRLNKAIESFIQTDAAINPGNSGGALVNTKGELIGINSAIASHTGSYEGYGFAVPVNLAKKVLNDLEKFGSVKRGYIGVNFKELNPDVANDLKISTTNGLYVADLVDGGGAQAAGLQKGDVITKFEGQPIYESSDLQERVGRLQPGDKVRLTVLRAGSEKNFTVTLKGEPAATNRTAAVSRSAEELYNKLGASFQPLTQQQKSKFRLNSGVVVTQVRRGGFFENYDIPQGSIITSMNGIAINSVNDIDKAITNLKNGQMTIEGYTADGMRFRNSFDAQ